MRAIALCLVAAALASCKHGSPAGAVLVDWSYTPVKPGDSVPAPLDPLKTVTAEATWPTEHGGPVQLRFETEIGDLVLDGVHWHKPRHVRITLAQPTSTKLPIVDCMSGPPGNKVVDGRLVPPVGKDGTPVALVGCFFHAPVPDQYVFEINGDGEVTGTHPDKK